MLSKKKRFYLSRQVARMVAFMEQEGRERVQEIDEKTEEEYQMTVGDLIQAGRARIKAIYDKRDALEIKNRIVQKSRMIHLARLEVLRTREEMIESTVDWATDRLKQELNSNREGYKNLMHKLILQAAVLVAEPVIGVRVREVDGDLLDNSLLSRVADGFKEVTGLEERLQFEVDNRTFLQPAAIGGVIVFARRGTILVDNTFGERINRVAAYASPAIRLMLFEPSVG
ncbi:hypothetical protein AAG570_010947 [Ranatra chinensis]|uniref:Uncharacterized protein n=1 Tax=Ranatra chinensis TaxID=642074 RepID=A0ABD0YLB0_9HEMI